MKKNRKFIIIIIGIILTISIGYALFSESLTIRGSASASLEGDLSVSCSPGITSDSGLDSQIYFYNYGHGNNKRPEKEAGYNNDSCEVNGKNISINTNLEYPRSGRSFTLKITNTTKFPMILDINNLKVNNSDEFDGFTMCNDYNNNPAICMSMDYRVDGQSVGEVPAIKPGESHYIIFVVFWNGEDETNDGEKRNANFVIEALFKQVIE